MCNSFSIGSCGWIEWNGMNVNIVTFAVRVIGGRYIYMVLGYIPSIFLAHIWADYDYWVDDRHGWNYLDDRGVVVWQCH